MKTIKTIIVSLIGLGLGLSVGLQSSYAQSDKGFYYETATTDSTTNSEEMTNLAPIIKQDNITNQTSILSQMRKLFQIDSSKYGDDAPAVEYVKMLLNMALGLVSFISLILLIFAFYLIFFDKGEDGVKKAKAILKGIAIAITLMGLSRIIVSFFFSLYSTEIVK